MDALVWGWLVFLLGWLFVMGSAVGSFLNVCIYRLPRGKNLFWPSSRCGACLTPIRPVDNMPLVAYWRLRGRCRACGVRFSPRYFFVELLTGVVFAGIYALEVGLNVHQLPGWMPNGFWHLSAGLFPTGSWAFFAAHAVLASLFIVAGGCLLDGERVPRGVVVFGAVAGLVWAALYPWPEPVSRGFFGSSPPVSASITWAASETAPVSGFIPWPVWGPLPEALPPGGLELGLVGAIVAIVLPASLVRLADLVGRRIGPAAPALLTMSGGFLGWQPLVVALAFCVAVSLLLLTLPQPRRRWLTGRALALILGANLLAAWLGWAWLGAGLRRVLFDPWAVAGLLLAVAVGLVVLSLLLAEDEATVKTSASEGRGGRDVSSAGAAAS